jgi:hypothetical protein
MLDADRLVAHSGNQGGTLSGVLVHPLQVVLPLGSHNGPGMM